MGNDEQKEFQTHVNLSEGVISKQTGIPLRDLSSIRRNMEKSGVPEELINRSIISKARKIPAPKK